MCITFAGPADAAAQWYSIPPFVGGVWASSTNGTSRSWTSPEWRTTQAWSECVLSWKSHVPKSTSDFGYQFEVRPVNGDPTNSNAPFISLAQWSAYPRFLESRSEPPMTNAHAKVLTDLIHLHHPAQGFQIRVTLLGDTPAAQKNLQTLMLSTRSAVKEGHDQPTDVTTNTSPAWGKLVLDVPPLSQHAYAGGKSWCSPTCLAMILQYWAQQLHWKKAVADVPEIAACVNDSAWGGTGNWSFNVAYLNREPALESVAVRLNGLKELEQSILANCPVVISVSLNLMRGQPRTRVRDGHLVVVCGFDDHGDIWVNDPDSTHPPVPSKPIRRKYRREDVLKAWDYSNRTAYLVWPANRPPPVPAAPLPHP